MKGGIEGCIQGCPLEGDGEVDASENETKFGRQVGGRETINYGGVVGGVGRMLNARLRLVTQGIGAPRQLWIKRAAWPQPLVPASNGRHRVSPRATWQRAICYFALSATRSLINLAALFAGRSACFIPRSGRHIPPDSLHPFSHPLSLFPLPFSREFDRSTRIRRRSKKEKMDTAKWIGAVSIALKFLSVCRDFLNKKKKKKKKNDRQNSLSEIEERLMDIHLAWIISFSLKFTTSLVPTIGVSGTFFFLSSNPTGNRQMNRKIHLETLKDIIERGEKKEKNNSRAISPSVGEISNHPKC